MHFQGKSFRTWGLLAGLLMVAGCVAPQDYTAPAEGGNAPVSGPTALGAGAGHGGPAGRAVGMLAPLTGPNAERGTALVQAAKVALAAPGSPPLDVHDTMGTPDGAAAAAAAAIAAGDGILIGPLTAAETAAAAGPATKAGIPMLAFTNDTAVARPGVWTMGLTPRQQVRRLVGAAANQGKSRFAALLPANDFGTAMSTALNEAVTSAGDAPPTIRTYSGDASAAVRDLSDYAGRRGPLDAQIRAAKALHTEEGRQKAAELSRADIPPPPFDALLLADTGERLATLTSFLPYYDVGQPDVRLMGPALWAAPSARAGANLTGAWYAAPDPSARADFDQRYQAAYNVPAPGLADLAYDAAAIARVIAAEGGHFTSEALCRPDGYAGVNGVLALQPDGRVRRALAVFEIQRGGAAQMIEPAPTSLSAPGI